MTTWSDAFSARPDHLLELVLTETSTNASANTSAVTATLRINPPSDSQSWNGFSDQNSYSFTFEGDTYTGSFTFDFRTDRSTKVLRTISKTVTHAANGTGDAQASGSASSDTLGSASISTKTLTLTDFVRLPSTPASPAVSRSSNGLTLTVTSAVATSPVTITDYDARWQVSGGSTWTEVSLGTDRVGTITVPSSTATYLVQTRAQSSEGSGAWSASTSSAGLPTAPASISTSRTGRSVTVTSGTATGTGITAYRVQYSSNGGSSWSSAVDMTAQAYTFTSLPAGLTYLFRVYAVNSVGSSAYTTSSALFVPAGGRRYDGSTFTPTVTAKRWDGAAWVDLTVAKRWNGTSWGDLT